MKRKWKYRILMLFFLLCIGGTFLPQKLEATSPVVEKAISWALAIAGDNSHGYSQSNRWGPDYDCSSFIISAFKSAGVDTGTATYTGNMKNQFMQHGFKWIPWSQIGGTSNLQRGDILLNEASHTEIYLGNGQNVGAHSDRGNPQTGDQTGTEVSVSRYYNHPWDGVLRYVGDMFMPEQAPKGSIDTCISGNGSIDFAGWAYDPDDVSAVVELRFEIGNSVYTVKANQTVDGYNEGLAGHAIAASIKVSERGKQNVKVWAIDTNGNKNTLIKECTLVINSNTVPIGHVDAIGGGEGCIGISGWASDADTPGQQVTLRVDIVGKSSYTFVTEGMGASGYPSFQIKLPVREFGTVQVKVYVLDQGPYKSEKQNMLIKTENMTIRQRHLISYIDTSTEKIKETIGSIQGMDGTLKIEGWVQDIHGIDRVEYEILDTSQSSDGVKGICERRNREDVANENPGYPKGNEGYFAYIPYKDLRYAFYYPEKMKILLTAYCKGGEKHSLGEIKINRSFPERIAPTISDIRVSNIDYQGYTIKATVTDASGIDRIQFPTWTLKDGQDDLVDDWGRNQSISGTLQGNTVTYRVNVIDHHNENGVYKTHIYAYDKYGNYYSTPINNENGEVTVPVRKKYRISYDGNGGTGIPVEQVKFENQNIEISRKTPSYLGYEFVGWKGIDKNYQPGDIYSNNRDEVLVAQWIEEEHHYIETITKNATCTEKGSASYRCSKCGKTYVKDIPATGHDEIIDKGIAATCETAGKTEGSHCSVCGKVLKKQEVIPASGHVWDEGKVQKEANCMEKGRMIYHCINCDETKTEDIPAVGHDLLCINKREATCTEEGYTGDDYCTACRRVIKTGKSSPKINHQWNEGEVIREATYDETGIKKYTCIHCGTEKIEEIPKRKKPSENGEDQNPNNSTGTPSSNNTGNGIGNEKKDSKIRNIRISGISTKIAAGKKVRLTADVLPGNARNKTVLWTSSNTKAATVSKDGVVKISKKAGGKKVTITACAADGSGVKANFQIKVMKGVVKKLSLKGNGTVKAGKSLKMTAKIIATKGANKKLIWSSNNPKYAVVSPAGKIKTSKTAKGKKVKITVMATDGSNKKATVTIKIK